MQQAASRRVAFGVAESFRLFVGGRKTWGEEVNKPTAKKWLYPPGN
jgi:hypothetical protein